jgi:hypothetical protein
MQPSSQKISKPEAHRRSPTALHPKLPQLPQLTNKETNQPRKPGDTEPIAATGESCRPRLGGSIAWRPDFLVEERVAMQGEKSFLPRFFPSKLKKPEL